MNVTEELRTILVVDWSHMASGSGFKWTYGQTPFSNFQFPLIGGFGYLAAIYGLQIYMKDRKPFSLHKFALIHNIFLTVLSFAMWIGSGVGAYIKYTTQGIWSGLLCEQDPEPMKGLLFYWSYIFYLSKFYEFIDTYILVLKKKPLIFLHVYHHFIMPFVCWAGLHGNWCMALWLSTFWNSFVHVAMYFYYSASCLGYSFWWKKYLTMMQISQFLIGVFSTTMFLYFYVRDISFASEWPFVSFTPGCTGQLWAIIFMYSVNCSFLFLFLKFFFSTYRSPRSESLIKKTE